MAALIFVPTPIGNLEDISFRAIRILKEVDFILAEDTRVSGKLLKYYEIENTMVSYHQHNEHKILDRIISRLKQGDTAAIITDAGTPGISDPGFLLARACIKEGLEIECLPGATAIIPALVVSGFPTDKFYFEGFLPPKKGRQSRILFLGEQENTIAFYESTHRIIKTLEQFRDLLGGERNIAVIKELSKLHEHIFRGTISELIVEMKEANTKGEFVVVMEGKK